MKIIYRYLLVILLLLGTCPLYSTDIPTDSLLMHLYSRATNLMIEGSFKAAQEVFDSAFAVPKVKQSPVYPILLNEQATLLVYLGEEEQAFTMKKNVLPYLSQIKDLEKHISIYNDLAILYRRWHMNDSTIYYYNKALDAALKHKDESWITHIYNNISIFYFNIRMTTEAEQYADLAARHATETNDPFVTFSTWQLRSGIKVEVNKLDEATYSIRKAWDIACHADGNSTRWKMRCMPSLLRIFEKEEQPDSVDYYLRLGNKLLKETPVNSIPAIGFIQVRASTEMHRGNYAKALQDFLWLRQKNTGSEPKTLLTQIACCYNALGNQQLAYTYMDSARMWTDTLAQQNLTQKMAELNIKIQMQEKELQINRLKQERLAHQTFLLKAAICAVCLLIVILIALFILHYKKKMAEKKIRLLQQENELNSARRYIEGLEAECKYFAKELHDGIANDLLGLQMEVENSTNSHQPQKLGTLIKQLRNNVRNISHELMPPEFEHLTLDEILYQYAEKLSNNTGIQITYTGTADNVSRLLPNEIAHELYRIVQEITMNIVKHANARHVFIHLYTEDQQSYILQITDDSTTPIPYETKGRGIGLRTVNDRAKSINGTITRESSEKNNKFTLQFKLSKS